MGVVTRAQSKRRVSEAADIQEPYQPPWDPSHLRWPHPPFRSAVGVVTRAQSKRRVSEAADAVHQPPRGEEGGPVISGFSTSDSTRARAKRKKSQGSSSRGLRPRGGEEEQGGVDLISLLPDEILGTIISLLSTKEGARTRILSPRWRHLWLSAPLNLTTFGWFCAPPNLTARHCWRTIPMSKDVVSRILAAHRGPGRCFCVSPTILLNDACDTLDVWLRSPALDGLQELELTSCYPRARVQSVLVPLSVQRFSSTLRVAKFHCCHFPADAARVLHLPNLQHLTLGASTISEDSLHATLAGCPALDSLLLQRSSGYRRLRIISPLLRCIALQLTPRASSENAVSLEELIIVNAPCLERLLLEGPYHRQNLRLSLISAPKLEMLGRLSEYISFQLGTTIFQGPSAVHVTTVLRAVKVLALKIDDLDSNMITNFLKCFPYLEKLYIKGFGDVPMTTVVPTIKVLALEIDDPSLGMIINFLTCFPCLEKLYIKIPLLQENVWGHKPMDRIECVDLHLKRIVFRNYDGNKSHVDFVKFFLLNARMLESMKLDVACDKIHRKRWIRAQRRQLQIAKKASKRAEVAFRNANIVMRPSLISRQPDQLLVLIPSSSRYLDSEGGS